MSEISTTTGPRVSIVIPVFNGSDFLAEAIDSALAQTYRNTEVLVVNDGSSDNGATERIARSYGDRIRYFSKPNGGVASALNLGISQMSGAYFSWLSHDDLYAADKIERQLSFLTTLPSDDRVRTIVYGDYDVFTQDPEKSVPVAMRGVRPDEFRYWLANENSLHGCTLLIPRSAFIDVGMFDEHLRTTQDYDLWFRMARQYRFTHVAHRFVKARSHANQGSVTMSAIAVAECNELLSGFVSGLSRDELLRATQGDLAGAYAGLAASMWYRGFTKAGWVTMKLALTSFRQSSAAAMMRAVGVMVAGVAAHYAVKPVRRVVPADIRAAMKRCLRKREPAVLPSPASVRNLGLTEKFAKIYKENMFRGAASRSGAGSDLVQTAIIRRELPLLVKEFGVRTFLDAPCGDWFWMREVDLSVERYIGIDIVEALIQKNQAEYGNSRVSFQRANLASDALPPADLIFSRDCLVHLSFADALKIIANFKRSGAKYLLTTTFPNRASNVDLGDGFWRPLNKQLAPFNFPPPVRLINENCTEDNGRYSDKCLGLWLLDDIKVEG